MQIVIDIPEMAYNLLKSDATIDWLDAENILDRIVEGIVLPKGHGDLIDRDELIKDRVSNDNTVILAKTAKTVVPAEKDGD